MEKLAVKDLNLKDKRVLMRVDFNVSLNSEGNITDDTRIKAALPTIRYILDRKGSPILISHLGRPKGEVVEKLRMDSVARRLEKLLGKKILKLDDCVGDEVEKKTKEMKPGEVILLENTRFHKEETKNDPDFARKLASLAGIFVNDAFGTAHRAHASTVGVARFLPSAAGLLMSKELQVLGGILASPQAPFVAVLGGAKVSDKIGVLLNLLDKCDYILIGGGMAYTFLKALDIPVGRSLIEKEKIKEAKDILEKASQKKCKILLPVDHLVAKEVREGAEARTVGKDKIPSRWLAVDIGPETVKTFEEPIQKAKTIFWNGPMGIFEIKDFAKGTQVIARMLGESRATVVVGGGDSIAALKKMGLEDRMSHISTGGGASLEFLEGKELPGVSALSSKGGKKLRRPIFGGNWKMHKTLREATDTVEQLIKEVENLNKVEVVILPPFTALGAVGEVVKGTGITLGAQNMHEEGKGAYTGEVSPSMLLDVGCEYVILGHSERRQYFGEKDNKINRKVKTALSFGLIPVLCVGEKLKERKAGKAREVVEAQLEKCLEGIKLKNGERLVVAYEPIWAIGTGETATPEQAQEMHHFIRNVLMELLGEEIALSIRIQYGGSVKPENIKGLMCQSDIDGALVGGASLDASSFARIIRYKE